MKIYIISLFPDMFQNVHNSSMMFKAQKIGAVQFEIIDLRQFGLGPRKQVDDTPYGGGDGMLLRIEPLVMAVESAKQQSPSAKVILMSARGKVFNQSIARELANQQQDLIFICGRYEGLDERILHWVDLSLSIGEFVLTGGELPAMMMCDAVVRLLPNVLGGENSAEIESFSTPGYLEYPQYTKPEVFRDLKVPAVLLSGHHAEIKKWRDQESNQKL